MLRVTTLANGLKVATIPSPSHFLSLGIYINTGSRNETDSTLGCSHMMDRMAFKSTQKYSGQDIVAQLEHVGGNISAHSSRETLMYHGSIFKQDLAKVVDLFSEMIQHPLFLETEIQESKPNTLFELSQLYSKPDSILPEYLHKLAYKNTLSNSIYISKDALEHVNSSQLHIFHKTWYTPDKMCIVCVGADHDAFVELVSKSFTLKKADPMTLQAQINEKSIYRGGVQVLDTTGKRMSDNPDDLDLTHIQIAFEAPSNTHPDMYATSILNMLMGGGGAFSAGGPGKGMFSRLYTRVLNRWASIEQCNMTNHTYTDSGLLVLTASILPDRTSHTHIMDILCNEFAYMAHTIEDQEFERAKNRLKSSLLMSLESGILAAEDIGRQLLMHGARVDPLEVVKRIDAVTPNDLMRVANNIVYGKNQPSPHNYPDLPDQKVLTGIPTVHIQGPLYKRDGLYKAEKTLEKWGFKPAKSWTDQAKSFFS